MKTKKAFLSLLLVLSMLCSLLVVPVSAAEAPKLTITPSVTTIDKGSGTANVVYTIELDPNGNSIAAFEFELHAPEGMTLSTTEADEQGGAGYWTNAAELMRMSIAPYKNNPFLTFAYAPSTGYFGAAGGVEGKTLTAKKVVMTIQATVDISADKTYTLGVTKFKCAGIGATDLGGDTPTVETVTIGTPTPTPTTYTVTVQNDGHGTASASPTSAAAGATVALTASPATNYHFKEWQVTPNTVTIGSDNTFTMPASAVTVKAIFEADTPATTPVTAAKFTLDTSTYAVGNKIVNLKVSGENTGLTTLGSYGTGYMIYKNDEMSDSVLSSSNETFAAATDYYLVVTLIAADGYTLDGLKKENVKLGTKTAMTVVPNPSDKTVGDAIFKLDQLSGGTTPTTPATYAVTVNGGGTGASGAGNYAESATVTINAGTKSGHTFSHWTSDDGVSFTDYKSASTTFVMPNKNVTVKANWLENITSANFTMTGYEVGKKIVDIKVTPDMATNTALAYSNEYYTGAYLISTDAGALSGTVTSFVGKDSADTFEAGKTYYLAVILNAASGRTLSGLTKEAVKLGTTSADALVEKTSNSVAVFQLAPLSDTTPPTPTTYAVTMVGGGTGASGAGNYAKGTTVTINAGTKSGYTFSGWTTSDGVIFTNANNAETTFTMPENAVTVTANWTKNSSGGGSSVSTYAITVEDAKNGDVTADRKSASFGTTVTVTVDPDKGYTLETLTVLDKNGKEVKLTDKGNGKYTFTMPNSKVTVTATFMEDNSMLNFFVDVPADAYYADAILWAAKEGITGGVDDVHFAPDMTCTRAQAVTFLWRAAGSPAPKSATMPFTDVPSGSYCYDAVLWAVENGITKGTTDTTFTPNAECSRAQIVTFLWRSQKSPAVDAANPFADVAADAYYTSAVLWAVKNGVTTGTAADAFSPDMDCTRAQIVTFIYRCMK